MIIFKTMFNLNFKAMKKQFFAIAAATLVVAGCTKTEVVKVAEDRAIGFSSFVGYPTKGIINSVDDLSSFKVFGGHTGNLTKNFNNVVVTKDGGAWTYTNTQYWEANKTYTFQAYAGTEATAEPTANGVQFTGFQATGDLDLLASDVLSVTTNGSSEPQGLTDGKVQFDFRHVLSMIKFTFVSELAENVNITISELTVKAVNSKGNYTLSAANTGTWGTLSEPNDYSLTVDGAFTSLASKASSEVIVMPQTIGADAIEVSFKLNATGGLTVTDAQHTVKLPEITWVEGNRYNYTATINIKNIDPENPDYKPIEFGEPKVDLWTEAEGGEILPQE